MITIVLFEDNKSLRQSLTRYFEGTDDVYLAGAYENANDAVAKIRKHRPDLVLMDIQMPGLSGIEAMQRIIAAYPDTKVLIHTVFEDEHRIFSAICGGGVGLRSEKSRPRRSLAGHSGCLQGRGAYVAGHCG